MLCWMGLLIPPQAALNLWAPFACVQCTCYIVPPSQTRLSLVLHSILASHIAASKLLLLSHPFFAYWSVHVLQKMKHSRIWSPFIRPFLHDVVHPVLHNYSKWETPFIWRILYLCTYVYASGGGMVANKERQVVGHSTPFFQTEFTVGTKTFSPSRV